MSDVLGLPNFSVILAKLEAQGLRSERDRVQIRLSDSPRDRVLAIVLDHIQQGGGSVSEWVKEALLMRLGLLGAPAPGAQIESEAEAEIDEGEALSADRITSILAGFR